MMSGINSGKKESAGSSFVSDSNVSEDSEGSEYIEAEGYEILPTVNERLGKFLSSTKINYYKL